MCFYKFIIKLQKLLTLRNSRKGYYRECEVRKETKILHLGSIGDILLFDSADYFSVLLGKPHDAEQCPS